MDVNISTYKYRIIAAYFPHAGYALTLFEAVIDNIRNCIHDAQRNGFKCLLGGDFNADIRHGWRGHRIRELAAELFLDFGNSGGGFQLH